MSSDSVSQMQQHEPHLEVLHRITELPTIELALSTYATTYARLKNSHFLINWALTAAESSLQTTARQAVPIARKLESPISFVDHTLCRGLDQIERKLPIVKERPEQILMNAYFLALETMSPAVKRAADIKDMSWSKVNDILKSEYGDVLVGSFDTTVMFLDVLIDLLFPEIDGMSGKDFPGNVSEVKGDKLLHTLQTCGWLSNKAARRVYAHVVHSLQTLHKDKLRAYLASVVDFLHMARSISVTGRSNLGQPAKAAATA